MHINSPPPPDVFLCKYGYTFSAVGRNTVVFAKLTLLSASSKGTSAKIPLIKDYFLLCQFARVGDSE